jgi:hypothetical protein
MTPRQALSIGAQMMCIRRLDALGTAFDDQDIGDWLATLPSGFGVFKCPICRSARSGAGHSGDPVERHHGAIELVGEGDAVALHLTVTSYPPSL